MITNFLQRCLSMPNNLLYRFQLGFTWINRLMFSHAVPVVHSIRSSQHEMWSSEGTSWSSEPGVGTSGREPPVPVHVVHLLFKPSSLRPVHPLLLLHQPGQGR